MGLTFLNWLVLLYKPITTQCHILTHQGYKAVENIVRKGEIACNKQFLLFSQRFLSYMIHILHLKYSFKCRLRFVSICKISKIVSSGNGLKGGNLFSIY